MAESKPKKKLNNKITAEELIALYDNYAELWKQIRYQIDHTPWWRFIKLERLYWEMHRLTRKYGRILDKILEEQMGNAEPTLENRPVEKTKRMRRWRSE